MNVMVPILLIVASLGATLGLVIYRDGLGHRPPPPSHRDWFDHP